MYPHKQASDMMMQLREREREFVACQRLGETLGGEKSKPSVWPFCSHTHTHTHRAHKYTHRHTHSRRAREAHTVSDE